MESHRRLRLLLALVLSFALLTMTALTAMASPPQKVAGCPMFPATNVWNKRIDHLPVHPDSQRIITTIGRDKPLHPDFSDQGRYGIPYNVVGGSTPRTTVEFWWPDESDAGPYPIPADPSIERGSDAHVLIVDRARCRLYELYAAEQQAGGAWTAGSGAIWNLRSNKLRRWGWTSADAAGLPILPGLVRYKDVKAGAIRHALRFTAPQTRAAAMYPARHWASELAGAKYPPMGVRVRLKKSVRIKDYPWQARVVLRALKQYGMILADNGSPWYVTGAPHARWNDDALHALHGIKGKDFEVVDTRRLRNG